MVINCHVRHCHSLLLELYDAMTEPKNCLGEILNFAFLLIQFVETDKFLNGKFAFYGLDAIKYLSLTRAEKAGQM